MAHALALDSRDIALELHGLLRDLDPSRWRDEVEEAARARLTRIEADIVDQVESSGTAVFTFAEHIDLLHEVYALSSQTNPLHSDLWPSITKYESEIVSMTAHMLGASEVASRSGDHVCVTVSSGGTESIFMAIKTARDWARSDQLRDAIQDMGYAVQDAKDGMKVIKK